MMSFTKKAWLSKCLLLAVLCFFAFNMSAYAAEEGKDYVVLKNPIPNQEGTLIKVFSYDCPFCYKYDKSVTPKVVALVADVAKFEVWHLKNKGKYGTEGSNLFASLITKDNKAGISTLDDKSSFKKAKMAYYAAYHDKKERWDAGAAAYLKTGMDAAGLSQEEFDKLLAEKETQDRLAKWEAALEIATVQGVPAFVVNGKYLIYTKSIRSVDGMATTIKELAGMK